MSFLNAFVFILALGTASAAWLLALGGIIYVLTDRNARAGDFVGVVSLLIIGAACAAGAIAVGS